MLEFAVIVPTLNERENVRAVIASLERTLAGVEWEVVFVDDDSPDGTAELCRQIGRTNPRVRVLHRIGRRGLASACIEGILATCAPYIAVMDGDLQHDETLLPEMLKKLKTEALDVVIGSRNVKGGSMGGFAASRVKLSNLGRMLSSRVLPCHIQDPMSGFFVADRRFVNEALPRISAVGFKILLDLLASSPRAVRFAEVPYRFRNRLHGASKLDTTVGLEYLTLILDKLIGNIIPLPFAFFALVGASGVLVHLTVLTVLLSEALASFGVAQIVATTFAIIANFFLNNFITHRDRRLKGRSILSGLAIFFVICSLGALSNFALAKYLFDSGWRWYLAGFVGMSVSSVWNYSATAVLTWRRMPHRRTAEGTRVPAVSGARTAASTAA